MQLIGKTLGQYRIVEQIGQGGMATVYKAFQASLDRYVAVKILPAHHAQKPEFKERFFREAQAVARLSHPNILPIYDVGMDEGICFFVMKIVSGNATMRERLGRQMPLFLASRFVDQIAGALDHAHKEGIVHRDIKSSNLLMEGEWIYLTDFGIAKIMEASVALTSTGELMGTPSYMSPEQGAGKPVDNRTDIYSLGIVLYEMLTGRVPFVGETPYGVIYKHIHEPLPLPGAYRPDLPEAVERVVLKALAKDPEDRHQTAGELADRLREAVASTVLSARSIPLEQISGSETTEIQSAPLLDLDRDTRVPTSPIDEFSSLSAKVSETSSDSPPRREETVVPASPEVGRLSSASRRSFLYASGAILLASVLVYAVSFRGTHPQRESPGQSREPGSSLAEPQASLLAISPDALFATGEKYYQGRGVTKDYREAMKWYLKAAEQGQSNAQYNIGLMYENGYGVGQDYREAMKWYLKAAEQGRTDAMHHIGIMYQNGMGVKRNLESARLWFQKAIDKDVEVKFKPFD